MCLDENMIGCVVCKSPNHLHFNINNQTKHSLLVLFYKTKIKPNHTLHN